jgi:hypothetical protein
LRARAIEAKFVPMRAFDFPYETVEVSCPVCGRYGRYSKARFCEIVGASTALPNALGIIAKDCPEDRPSPRNLAGRCRVGFPQLAQAGAAQRKGE